MTCIAWDGKVLAADSQITSNGHRRALGPAQKIFVATPEDNWTIEGKKIQAFGFGGRYAAVALIKSLLTVGVKHDTKVEAKDMQFSILAIAGTGEVFKWIVSNDTKKQEQMSDIVPVTGPTTIGSGGVFAEAVLAIGMSAVNAVKAAIRLDVMSGGNVNYWEAWKGHLETVLMPEPCNKQLLTSRLVEEATLILNEPVTDDTDVKSQLLRMRALLDKPEYAGLR